LGAGAVLSKNLKVGLANINMALRASGPLWRKLLHGDCPSAFCDTEGDRCRPRLNLSLAARQPRNTLQEIGPAV
jgi:hypothetical protein